MSTAWSVLSPPCHSLPWLLSSPTEHGIHSVYESSRDQNVLRQNMYCLIQLLDIVGDSTVMALIIVFDELMVIVS